MSRKPSIALGAVIGGLLTAPLLALIYVGQQFAGLPFLPSDFFNPVRDLTPGDIIVGTIQLMVEVILSLNLGRVDIVAKAIETAMAIGMVFVVGVISGAVFFAIFNRTASNQWRVGGIIGGLIVGVPMALISYFLGVTSTVEPRLIGSIWLIALFVVWGWAHAFVYRRLAEGSKAKQAAANARVEALNRRQFLVSLGAASATITVVGAGLGALLRRDDSSATSLASASASEDEVAVDTYPTPPNSNDPVIPAPGTRAEITPVADHYRIDIATIPPIIDERDWILPFYTTLGGEERLLAEFTLDELKAYEPISDFITMSCISNRIGGDLISTTYWTGVSLQRLLQDVPLPEGATHLKISSADGFDETVALNLVNNDARVMLAYYWAGRPLETKHGFPLRIHVPDLYGMKQPKWITRIDVLDADQEGYWVRRGWDEVARVRTTSVIDTVAVDMMIIEDDQQLIPIGGIAWSGARGISRVEVRVDDGEWQEARVRAPNGDRTWVIWRYDWPFAEGRHTFEVRCLEGDGSQQLEAERGVRPSGATGIHSQVVTI